MSVVSINPEGTGVRIQITEEDMKKIVEKYNSPEQKNLREYERFKNPDKAWVGHATRDAMQFVECCLCLEKNWCVQDSGCSITDSNEWVCKSCDEDDLWDMMHD